MVITATVLAMINLEGFPLENPEARLPNPEKRSSENTTAINE